jgi:hypothetical protein
VNALPDSMCGVMMLFVCLPRRRKHETPYLP